MRWYYSLCIVLRWGIFINFGTGKITRKNILLFTLDSFTGKGNFINKFLCARRLWGRWSKLRNLMSLCDRFCLEKNEQSWYCPYNDNNLEPRGFRKYLEELALIVTFPKKGHCCEKKGLSGKIKYLIKLYQIYILQLLGYQFVRSTLCI